MSTAQANSRTVKMGELDKHSLHTAYAAIPIEALKEAAQKMREDIDFRGRSRHNYELHEAMLYVIRIAYPDFDTVFVPAK